MTNDKLTQKIMKKIETDKVRMKPRWWFTLINSALLGVTLVGIFLASIILSATVYLIKTKTPLELWDYGAIGVEVFLKDFPYLWLLCGIVFVGVTGMLVSKIDSNYKKTTLNLLSTTILLVLIATVTMTLLIKFRF